MTAIMKAIVYERYVPPEILELKEVDKPTPGPNQAHIEVHAAADTKYDRWVCR